MRIIFAGTPEFAAKALEALIQSEHEVVMVLSQPDRPAGRGRKLKESAVKALAKQHHIPVYTPLSLRVEKGGEETAEVLAKMQEANADVLVVAAYGLIVPQFVLDIPSGVLPQKYPTLKAVNIHGSLLPQWRGAAPIARAIERGDKETGITLMQMDAGLDTGPMLMKRSVEITPEDTAGDLTETLSRLGAEMLIEYLRDPEAFPPLPQPEGATYASSLRKRKARLTGRRLPIRLPIRSELLIRFRAVSAPAATRFLRFGWLLPNRKRKPARPREQLLKAVQKGF